MPKSKHDLTGKIFESGYSDGLAIDRINSKYGESKI